MLTALFLFAAAATLSVEDYATMPQVSSPRWSPDGGELAYVLTSADLTRSVYDEDVRIVSADGRNDRRLTSAAGSETRPRWSPDGTRIAFLSDRDGPAAIHVVERSGGDARVVTKELTPIRAFEWSPDGKSIAFTRIDARTPDEERRGAERDDARVVGSNAKHMRLYLLDLATGAVRLLTSGDASIINFTWSPDGRTIVVDRTPSPAFNEWFFADLYLVNVADGTLTPLVVRPGLDTDPQFSPDGRSIAFRSAGGRPGWIIEHDLYVVPAAGGTPRHVTATYGSTPERFGWTPDSRALWIAGPRGLETRLFRIAADGSAVTMLPSGGYELDDPSLRGDRIAFICQSLTEPPELCTMPLGGAPRRVTNHNATLRTRALGTTRVVRWKNPQDGLEIEGLLTLPVGHRGGPVPLLTFVHGGPASRFDQNFLGYLGTLYAPHALAARGFAVFRPNPRGTGGYGLAFRSANVSDWGGMDWLDVNAGIDKLIADGIADPDRLGLMGWSYGGYLATWALTQTTRFKAVSIGAPIVDLLSFHGTADIRGFIPSYFPEMPLELLRARSPLWQLTKKPPMPILIQHGEADERVPLSQSTMLYRRLDELGADVTMVIYPRTPHTPREPKLRMDVARRNLEFFTKHVK